MPRATVAHKLRMLADAVEILEKQPQSDYDAVGEFHRKFGLEPLSPEIQTELPDELIRFRLRFMLEELLETAQAYGFELQLDEHPSSSLGIQWKRFRPAGQTNLPKVFDGLIDLVYVALGTAQFHRLPWAEGFAEVQRANLNKQRALIDGSNSMRKSSYDVIKPFDWQPPDILGVLMRNGWRGHGLEWGEGSRAVQPSTEE